VNSYRMRQKTWMDFNIIKGDANSLSIKKIEIIAADADSGLRVLPWKDSALTFMRIDSAATWFLTGVLP